MRSQNYDYIAVGSRIKNAREKIGLTQEQVSKNVGVNIQHISDIERGEVGLSVGTLIKICDVLDIAADYLLFDVEAAPANICKLVAGLDEQDLIFIEEFIKLYIKRVQ